MYKTHEVNAVNDNGEEKVARARKQTQVLAADIS